MEIEVLDAGVRTSRAVADYVRAMLKVRSLRRAVGEALLEVEHCKQQLTAPQLAEAAKLPEGVVPPAPKAAAAPSDGTTSIAKRPVAR